MATDKDRYGLKIEISIRKEGQDGPEPWILTNEYNGMDYGQLVTTQAVLVKSVGDALMKLGIGVADGLGFNVSDILAQLSGGGSGVETEEKQPRNIR